jgi:uncharacterized membrane protein
MRLVDRLIAALVGGSVRAVVAGLLALAGLWLVSPWLVLVVVVAATPAVVWVMRFTVP